MNKTLIQVTYSAMRRGLRTMAKDQDTGVIKVGSFLYRHDSNDLIFFDDDGHPRPLEWKDILKDTAIQHAMVEDLTSIAIYPEDQISEEAASLQPRVDTLQVEYSKIIEELQLIGHRLSTSREHKFSIARIVESVEDPGKVVDASSEVEDSDVSKAS